MVSGGCPRTWRQPPGNLFLQFLSIPGAKVMLKKFLPLLLLFACVAGPSPLFGKTVALVYDDSGSMGGNNKWCNANYAVQVLAAFLDSDDKLLAVRMNSGKGVEALRLSRHRRQNTLQAIRKWPKPKNGQTTPYFAVETAANIFTQQRNIAPGPLGEQEADWLIITTDGEFNTSRDTEIADSARTFFASPAGLRTRVAFLLIEADTAKKRKAANIWKNIAPEQVEIISADSRNIAGAMEKIIGLIAGRDKKLAVNQHGSTIHFSTVFPLKRITLFEQNNSGKTASLQTVTLSGGNGIVDRENLVLHKPQSGFSGRITHLIKKGSLPAGDYVLAFDRRPNLDQLSFFIEPAVDFSVSVLTADGKTAIPSASPGSYTVCRGEQVRFAVSFQSVKGGQPEPLAIDQAIADKLSVRGRLNSDSIRFSFVQNRAGYLSTTRSIDANAHLSVEARYPGYFHYKSNIITIKASDCSKTARLTSNTLTIPITYAVSKDFTGTGAFTIVRKGDDYQGHHYLSVQKLPKGVQLEVDGKTITSSKQPVQVNLVKDHPLPVTILTNEDFHPRKPVSFLITISTDNRYVRKIDPLKLTLELRPRQLAVVPAAGTWRVSFTELGKTPGPSYILTADGKEIPPDQLTRYSIEVDTDSNLPVSLQPVQGTSSFRVRVRRPFFACFTDTGKIPITLTLDSGIPGEKVQSRFFLVIDDTDWWTKCRRSIFTLLAMLAFLAYLIACGKKRRFARDGVITYERENPLLGIRPRPEEFYLAGWLADDGNKLWNFILRWFIPFIPERRVVAGITFEAGTGKGSIILPEGQQRSNMKIAGIPIDDPGIRPMIISQENTLEVVSRNHTERYSYHRK